MFCTNCGSPIAADQAVCSKCGHATTATASQHRGSRVYNHYRTVGILQIVYSGLHAIAGIGAVIVAHFIFSGAVEITPTRPPMFVQPMMEMIGWFLLGISAIGFVGGIGLLSRAPWARTLTLIAGFIELLNVPFGTALGIYVLWVLLSSDAREDYRRLSFAQS